MKVTTSRLWWAVGVAILCVLACSQPPDRIKQSPTQSTPTPHSDEALGDWIAIERSSNQSTPHAYSDEALGEMWDAIRVFFQPDDLGFRCREGFDQKGRFTGMCFRHLETEGLVSFFYDRGEKGVGVEFFIYEQDSFGGSNNSIAMRCHPAIVSVAQGARRLRNWRVRSYGLRRH